MVTSCFPFNRRRVKGRIYGVVGAGESLENDLTQDDITWAIQHTNTSLSLANEKGNRSFTIKPYHSEIDLIDEEEYEDEDEDEDEDEVESDEDQDDESVTAVGSPEASRRLEEAKDAESDGESEVGQEKKDPQGKKEPSGEQIRVTMEKKQVSLEGFNVANHQSEGKTEPSQGKPPPPRHRGRPAQRYMEYVRDRSNVKSIFRPSSQYLRSFKLLNKPNPPPRRFQESIGESIDPYI